MLTVNDKSKVKKTLTLCSVNIEENTFLLRTQSVIHILCICCTFTQQTHLLMFVR